MRVIVDYYDKLAKEYDADRFGNSYGQFIDSRERCILDKLIDTNAITVLDLACGSGRLLNYATCGADASSEMIKVAGTRYPDKALYLSDAENLPFPDASVDCILSFHFFMHLDEHKIHKILQECYRILKPGGRLIFDFPSKKRRRLLNFKASGWHGATSFTLNGVEKMCEGCFAVKRTFGLLLFPIHRVPKPMRKFFGRLDAIAASSLLKEYSSYLVVELIKKQL